MESVAIALAFFLGLAFHRMHLPPLVGYLVAGFALHAFGFSGGAVLDQLAHAGVLLLLFSVGLKLRLRNLIRFDVWGSALFHMVISATVAVALLIPAAQLGWSTAIAVALALTFSSTVLAAKVLEEQKEVRAFHGRMAIGILIVQDLAAVAILGAYGAATPSPWAFGLLVLPLLRPVLCWLLEVIGHDELQVLYGLLLALVGGGLGFAALGLSPELGALVAGTLLAGHPRAIELSNSMWGLREVFLVGFFLQIGLYGLPTIDGAVLAMLLVLALPLKCALYFFILLLFRLRAHSSFLTALSLATYSEFGLIVAGKGVEQGWLDSSWLVTLALAAAISFALAAPVYRIAHRLYLRLEPYLHRFELKRAHPDELPDSIGKSHVLIVGMGRVGSGAYDYFTQRGVRAAALDSDPGKVQQHLAEGRRVLPADAEDPSLWQNLNIDDVQAVLLALPDFESKRIAATELRRRGYRGMIAATSSYPEETTQLVAAGVDHTPGTFYELGAGLANFICDAWDDQQPGGPVSVAGPKPGTSFH